MLNKPLFLTGISIAFLLFITVHFTMINIYSMPYEWGTPKLQETSRKYTLPLFHQSWRVFAPVPREEGRLYYKFCFEGKWSDEFSFREEMKKKNHISATRIADMLSFNLMTEVRFNSLEVDGKRDYTLVKKSKGYGTALYGIYAHIRYKQLGQKPDSVCLIIERDLFPKKGYSKKKTIRDSFKPDSFSAW